MCGFFDFVLFTIFTLEQFCVSIFEYSFVNKVLCFMWSAHLCYANLSFMHKHVLLSVIKISF